MDLKEVHIWNIKFNLLTAKEIADVVDIWLDQGRKGIHLTGVDTNVLVRAQKDDLLRTAILESDIVNVDSYMPAKKLRQSGHFIKERVTTPDVMEECFKNANDKGQKVFLFGATEETVTRMRNILIEEYPKMKIVGYRNGYYSSEEEPTIAEHISSLSPDYLFIGMPTPRKEHFIMKYKREVDVGVLLGVGGAFDAKAGTLKRPPKWLRGHGLEAFFRVLRRPGYYGKHLWIFYDLMKLTRK